MNRIALVALALMLGACASNDAVDLEPAELVDFEQTVKFETLWSEKIGAGQDERYTRLAMAIAGDNIFATDVEGNVEALNRLSGDQLWAVELDTPVSGGVGRADGVVLLGTYAGEVIALEQSTGAERWRAQLTGEVLSAPQGNGDVVVAQTLDGHLVGLDLTTGEQRWSYNSVLPVLTLRGTSAPVVSGSRAYAGFASGKVMSIETDSGLLSWEQRVAMAQGRSELERVVDIDGTPLLVGDILFAASYQGRLVALNRSTGRGIWAKDASTHQDLTAGQGNVYLASAEDKVIAFEAGSGAEAWENHQLIRRKITAPRAFDSYLAVDDFYGYVHVLDQNDGQFVARRKIDGAGIRSSMTSAGDVLYVLGDSGKLVALKIQAN